MSAYFYQLPPKRTIVQQALAILKTLVLHPAFLLNR